MPHSWGFVYYDDYIYIKSRGAKPYKILEKREEEKKEKKNRILFCPVYISGKHKFMDERRREGRRR